MAIQVKPFLIDTGFLRDVRFEGTQPLDSMAQVGVYTAGEAPMNKHSASDYAPRRWDNMTRMPTYTDSECIRY